MGFPDFIMTFPALDIPFSDDVVQTRAIRSDAGLVVFFTFLQDVALPEHAHGPQWGTVVEGSVTLTINGETRSYGPGDSYSIGSGVAHAVQVTKGTKAIDVFAEADRYPVKLA